MTSTLESSTETEQLVDGLRDLADFIEANPQFADALSHPRFLLYTHEAEDFARLASELGGDRQKDADDNFFGVSRFFGAIELYVYTSREQVCEARVVGTERVLVPDPNAPAIEIERDVVQWECKPILGGAS